MLVSCLYDIQPIWDGQIQTAQLKSTDPLSFFVQIDLIGSGVRLLELLN